MRPSVEDFCTLPLPRLLVRDEGADAVRAVREEGGQRAGAEDGRDEV